MMPVGFIRADLAGLAAGIIKLWKAQFRDALPVSIHGNR